MQTTETGLPHLVCLSKRAFTKESLREFMSTSIALPATVVFDGLNCYTVAQEMGMTHDRTVTGGGPRSVELESHRAVNAVLGNLKTAMSGTYHAIKFARYAHRYLAEVQYRFNRRYDLRPILPRIVRAATSTPDIGDARLRGCRDLSRIRTSFGSMLSSWASTTLHILDLHVGIMDLHFATERVASIKDAALRYLVIVAGILTALLLNQFVESRQNARLARTAKAAIESETKRNELVLRTVLAEISKQQAQLTAAEEILGKDSFANSRLSASARLIVQGELLNGVGSISIAGLQRSAWDGAISAQALQFLPSDFVVSRTRAYAAISEVGIIIRQLALSDRTFQNVWAIDAFSRNESGDPMRFARALREQRLTLKLVETNYLALLEALTFANPAQENQSKASASAK